MRACRSTRQVPGYVEEAKNLKALGIDEVIIFCVNDGAVMDAWAEDQGVDQKGFITMMGDPTGTVTRALGMGLDHPGPMYKLGYERCKRFVMYIEDGTIKLVRVAEGGPNGEEDPAGDDCAQTAAPLTRARQASLPSASLIPRAPFCLWHGSPRADPRARLDCGDQGAQEEGRALNSALQSRATDSDDGHDADTRHS